jgi:hypothetical protein
MGTGNAQEMNRQILKGAVALDTALLWHLTSNHYPPVPAAMVPVAKKAIEHANLGEWDASVKFPEGWVVNNLRQMEVSKIVEIMHLDAFIENVEFLTQWLN